MLRGLSCYIFLVNSWRAASARVLAQAADKQNYSLALGLVLFPVGSAEEIKQASKSVLAVSLLG